MKSEGKDELSNDKGIVTAQGVLTIFISSLLYSAFLPFLSSLIPLIILMLATLIYASYLIVKGHSKLLLQVLRNHNKSIILCMIGGSMGLVTYIFGIRSYSILVTELMKWYSSGEINLALLYLLISMTSIYYLLLISVRNRFLIVKLGTSKRKSITKVRVDLYNYVLENPGGPLVIVFMVFLVIAAIGLAKGLESFANRCAEIAYYYLVAGVLAQLVATVREERRKQ